MLANCCSIRGMKLFWTCCDRKIINFRVVIHHELIYYFPITACPALFYSLLIRWSQNNSYKDHGPKNNRSYSSQGMSARDTRFSNMLALLLKLAVNRVKILLMQNDAESKHFAKSDFTGRSDRALFWWIGCSVANLQVDVHPKSS